MSLRSGGRGANFYQTKEFGDGAFAGRIWIKLCMIFPEKTDNKAEIRRWHYVFQCFEAGKDRQFGIKEQVYYAGNEFRTWGI